MPVAVALRSARVRGVVARKAPQLRALVAVPLDRAAVEVLPAPGPASTEAANRSIAYRADAAVLAEALSAGIDFFVSLNRAHFVDNAALDALPFRVDTPGECLAWLRTSLRT